MSEAIPKTKAELLLDKIVDVRERLDRIGGEMDENIVETVALVNLLGLPTDGSCQGHLDHGLANPWVSVTALDEPEYHVEGEREVKERIALAHGIQPGDVERGVNEAADEEYYKWLEASDAPLTPDYSAWRAQRNDVMRRAMEFVQAFNEGRSDGESLRIHAGSIIAGEREPTRESTDPDGMPGRLKARQEVMAAFTEYLRQRFLSQA